MKTKLPIILIAIALIFSLVGCGINSNTGDNEYNMEYATDAQQYCIFMNRQINVILNQLSSNMIVAHDVAQGEYPASDALKTAEQSMGIIQAAREEVEKMMPPEKYKDTRDNTLRVMVNAENDIQTYIDELKRDELRTNAIDSLASIMQTDFAALTAEFNQYYE